MTIEQTSPAADETTLRNKDLKALAAMLQEQQTRKVDFVAPAASIRAEEGMIVVTGAEAELTEDGVTQVDGVYQPTSVMLDGLAAKLDVPVGYLKRTHRTRPDLWDANVNGWLHGRKPKIRNRDGEHELIRPAVPGDDRSFLVRTFRGEQGPGLGRAFLSDGYKLIDNLDALMATLDGVRAAGVDIDVRGCDLSDSRMYVRLLAPQISAYAPELLKGYRSPFTGATGDENPTVFAGFVISNSEVGAGAYSITPQIVVEICGNGATITKDVQRSVHVGSRMAEGLIRWSDETRAKEIELIRSKTKDAVRTFLDVGYVTRVIADLEKTAGKPIDGADKVVRAVGKKLAFSEEQISGVLDHFIQGGQRTAGGVLQAVTSYAQTIKSADAAADVEAQGVKAMELAAAM
ncbi:DUF932 domain-containing protein [Kribbella sp. NPDC049174]|uniref:DUF932 domain-containing protein n=1 Tax=Kribbella sp. NPDC049174 TaxID=3364112 RepID=UPI00371DB5D7